MLFLIPLIYWFEPIFLLLRVDEEAAHIAATYMRYVALGIPVSCFSHFCVYCSNSIMNIEFFIAGVVFVRVPSQVLPGTRSNGWARCCCYLCGNMLLTNTAIWLFRRVGARTARTRQAGCKEPTLTLSSFSVTLLVQHWDSSGRQYLFSNSYMPISSFLSPLFKTCLPSMSSHKIFESSLI